MKLHTLPTTDASRAHCRPTAQRRSLLAVRVQQGSGPSATRDVSTRAVSGATLPPASSPGFRVLPDGPAPASKLPLPDGQEGWPIVGETFELSSKGMLRFGLERYLKYGPIFKTKLFGYVIYMVVSPEYYKAIMAEDTKAVNFEMGGAMKKVQGPYLMAVLTNKDNMRMPFRKSLMPALTNEALDSYMTTIADITAREIKGLAGRASWDTREEARALALKFSCKLLAGFSIESKEDEQQLQQDMQTMTAGMLTYDVDLPGTPLNKALAARDRFLQRILGVATKQVQAILKEPRLQPGQVKVRKNFLGYIIDYQRAEHGDESINLDFIANWSYGTLLAGTDTSATGLLATLAIVAQLPDVMDKVHQEQQEVIAKFGPEMTRPALDASRYLDAVVKEATRLKSPADQQWRIALKDLEVGGKYLPKGSIIAFNHSATHALDLEPEWPKGVPLGEDGLPSMLPLSMDGSRMRDAFQPERWLDPERKPANFTFGHGPHTCVGMTFYYLEAKALLATIARDYKLEPLTPVNWAVYPKNKLAQPVQLRLVPRSPGQ